MIAIRRFGPIAGLLLLIGLATAPVLPPATLRVVGFAWDLLLVAVLGATIVVVARRIGWPVALVLTALGVGIPIWLSGTDWSGALGTRLPCRRDWAWQPSYFLRSSPTRSVDGTVGDVRIRICYGRPRTRGRRMIGGPPVPYGHLWRTGANEPTTIRADGPITIAGILVPAGKASLYTIPGPETWEVVLNRSTRQWGLESEYTGAIRSQELGRTVVPARPLPDPVEVLDIAVQPNPTGTDDLVIRWERIEVRLPIAAARR